MSNLDHSCGNSIPTPEEDIIIFKNCKREGDLKHGIFHLSCAIASNPENQVWLGYLDDLIETTRDILSLIPLDEGAYFAVVAVKAYVYAATGDYNQAFSLLSQVIRIEPEIIISFIGGIIYMVEQFQDDLKSKIFNAFSRILNAMATTYCNNHLLFWVLSAIQRRQNEMVLAMENAQKAYKIKKCWQTAIGVALAFKCQENIEEAIKYYEIAASLEPQDSTAYLDIGDIYFENAHYSESAKAYKKAINVDKDNNWAIPSLYFCEFMIKRDIQWSEKLKSYNKDNPENQRASYLLDLINTIPQVKRILITYHNLPKLQLMF